MGTQSEDTGSERGHAWQKWGQPTDGEALVQGPERLLPAGRAGDSSDEGDISTGLAGFKG